MPSITWLKDKLAADHQEIKFAPGNDFAWDPISHTVHYATSDQHYPELLHETAHALLGHRSYRRDIELLRMEREAWDYAAQTLAPTYSLSIDGDVIEEALDTYRDWLHRRSSCPSCSLSGIQESATAYRCISCTERWTVNEARTCQLKRTRVTK